MMNLLYITCKKKCQAANKIIGQILFFILWMVAIKCLSKDNK